MTSDTVHRLLIAYDIVDDRRRARVSKVLLSYGDRIQYSVFLADARPVKLARLRRAVVAKLDTLEDSVLFVDLGPLSTVSAKRFTVIGVGRPVTDSASFLM